MDNCIKDNAPCLHAPCCESMGVRCCGECGHKDKCTTACFKSKE